MNMNVGAASGPKAMTESIDVGHARRSVGLTSGSARGDIPPIVTGEYVFVILMEVVGTVALGLILGSLSSMFMVRVTLTPS
eukprot:COSAG04_NODE_1300_length_7317_cov_56.834682_7_plen_81_part_00